MKFPTSLDSCGPMERSRVQPGSSFVYEFVPVGPKP